MKNLTKKLTLPQVLVLIVIRDDRRHLESREFRALRTLKRLGLWEFALDEKKCGRALTEAGARALAEFEAQLGAHKEP